jgi:hypothetical protein
MSIEQRKHNPKPLRRFDIRSEAADVRKAYVVGENDDGIRSLRCSIPYLDNGREKEEFE